MRSYFLVPFTHAPPQSLKQAILYAAMILRRLSLQIVDKEMSAIKGMYVLLLLLLLLFIYLIKLFLFLYDFSFISQI